MSCPAPDTAAPLVLVPVNRDTARAFVRRHHRHGSIPPVGDVIRVGLSRAGQLVGVAIAGRPVARALDDGVTLEVLRVCTVGDRNACSRLYGALSRAAAALGYRRLVTYTLTSEPGSSLRAVGFVTDGGRRHRPSDWRTRHLYVGSRSDDLVGRIRWVKAL